MEHLELYRALLRVAGEAAGLLRDLQASGSGLEVVKGDTIRADLESEQYIIDALRSEGVRGLFIAEENGVLEEPGPWKIIIDPLDGSRNYSKGIPWSSVSIAVAPRQSTLSDVIAGVVYPLTGIEPIGFARGHGCFRRFTRLDRPGRLGEFIYVYVDNLEALNMLSKGLDLLKGHVIRSMGSAALEISLTGIGVARAFLDMKAKLRVVDVAAAAGIVWECGGSVRMAPGVELDSPLQGIERFKMVLASLDHGYLESWRKRLS